MESNKEDARRAKEVAEQKFQESDLAGAKKFAFKAQQMYPSLEGISHLIAVIDVHVAAADVNGIGLPNWYAILQVPSSADEAVIKKQYRRLALLLHPDKNKSVGAEAAFKLIGEASRLLSHPTNRAAYDRNRNQDPYSAFWTLCPFCNVRLQFHIAYLNCNLICPQCTAPFMAVPLAAPPSHSARHKGNGNTKENQMPARNKDQAPSKPRPSKSKGKENHTPTLKKDQAATRPQPSKDKKEESNTPAHKKDQAATTPQPPKDKDKESYMPACNKDEPATKPQPPKDNSRPTHKNDQAAKKSQPTKDKESHMTAHSKEKPTGKSQPSKDHHKTTHDKDQAATKPQPPKEKENAKKRKGKKDVKFDKTAFDRLFAGGVRRTPLDEQSNKRAKIQVN